MTRTLAFIVLGLTAGIILLPALLVTVGSAGRLQLSTREGQYGRAGGSELFIKVYNVEEEELLEMPLEEYIVGVVAAEMPAGFHQEALKAQAVAARTYTLRHMRFLGGRGCDRHKEADVCTDHTHCQAWVDEEEYASSPADYRRVRRAVEETAGEVLVFEGELIEAVYHSTCGGKTEEAATVWAGSGKPYLQSVPCPYCTHSPYYRQRVVVGVEDFRRIFQKESEAVPVLNDQRQPIMEVLDYSSTGRIAQMRIGQKVYAGAAVRNLLALPSTNFTWVTEGERIVFEAQGFGHGVGLCQYGADGMGADGFDYRQILAYYYPGTELQQGYKIEEIGHNTSLR